ncbi:MAG TPA: transglutaminase-like domain-containing protein [Rhodopila sp.]|jgi:regulator of sirC expression with transglutaminase-like and TPR domain|nr:transglutaminase-like domain-containing protein [Rhodopila sp.]
MTDPRAALRAIGQLPDAEIDIGSAALQLARVDAPQADWRAAARHLSELAQGAVRCASALGTLDLPARAAALAALLVDQFGYEGDAATYDDPANANLIRVIERRRGLPVALGVIWLHTARAAGWDSHGVDFPSHFLVALDGRKTQVVVDVFNGGQVMAARELRALLKRVEGDDAALRPGILQPMSTRRVLLRLQNNIMTRRLDGGDLRGGLRCMQDMLLIAPDQAELWRQAGAMHQRLEQVAAARACYLRFLDLVPEGRAANGVRAQLDILKSMLN